MAQTIFRATGVGAANGVSGRGGVIGRGAASAPGSCGELAQGMLDGNHYLVTCPIDMRSAARVELRSGSGRVCGTSDATKARRAVKLTLAHFGRGDDVDARLWLSSPLPRGKGMASSSADVAAAIAAAARALGASGAMPPTLIARLALRVEPSDGIMLPGIALFDHRRGSAARTLGDPPPMRVIALDFGGRVDTVAFNKIDRDAELRRLRPEFEEALALVERGARDGCAADIGAGASLSAVANQRLLPKPQLDAALRFARSEGALGVNAAHSGSALGLLTDDDPEFAARLAARARQRLPGLRAIYNRRIVGGGVRAVDDADDADAIGDYGAVGAARPAPQTEDMAEWRQ